MELELRGLELASEIFKEVIDQGHYRKGTQALMKTLERNNKVELDKYNI